IATQGSRSSGIVAVSQGGDGKQGGHLWNAAEGGGILSEGGKGGQGGKGANVTLTSSATISTRGDNAHGILAASLSGAAGNGGHGTKGGAGAAAGIAGKVSLTNTGKISTQGESAHGLVAQNVGGVEKPATQQAAVLNNL